ncbi:hypothetical protein OC25_23155 [Pedobacter kyungheensis]|uniref:Immunity MXAN-0049 protein domain-containing protein n=1 Tax=Pedobacter kyungheensis TaxID=1069985 RepID=A0A0C1FHB9_9SPHI|nr:DUF1629 domain-containing protein [Pedobacter kyungheensis]KIA91158.1 hypothetical protein OC25_23155 [Pedobacter kyungheensis]
MYYRIKHSLDLKIVGQSSQIQDAELPMGWDNNPKFIEHIEFKKVDFEPLTSTGILHKKAKLTDLISTVPAGFTRKLLISPALKVLFEEFDKGFFQYFKCNIRSKEVAYEYWIVNPVVSVFENVDFLQSNVSTRKPKPEGGGTYLEPVKVNTLGEFNTYLTAQGRDSWRTSIDHVYFKTETTDDVFALANVEGGVGYYVSERFKTAVEQQGFTGIEFAPSTLNMVEWLHNERKKHYN